MTSLVRSTASRNIPRVEIDLALADATLPIPRRVDPIVAAALARLGSDQSRRLTAERLARVGMALAPHMSPADVWADGAGLAAVDVVSAMDRTIRSRWPASIASRNAHRAAVRSVIRAAWTLGRIDADHRDRCLAALADERRPPDTDRDRVGHIDGDTIRSAFARLAADPNPRARRDAAILALGLGLGLRRSEIVDLNLDDLDGDLLRVAGKGGKVRRVPLPPDVRRALEEWIQVRGGTPGPLLAPLTVTAPATVIPRRLSVDVVRAAVRRHLGTDVAPHDMRRTAVGSMLAAGIDVSIVGQVVGHTSPATTARYDRRGLDARRAAMDGLRVGFIASHRCDDATPLA